MECVHVWVPVRVHEALQKLGPQPFLEGCVQRQGMFLEG